MSLEGFLSRLNGGVPSQPPPPPLFAGSFLLFISSNSDFSNRVTHAASLSLQLSFGVTGRESPTVGPGHSPQLNPLHLGSITPTLPISLRESLSFGEIWLYCDLMKYFAIIYRLLDESIAPRSRSKFFTLNFSIKRHKVAFMRM